MGTTNKLAVSFASRTTSNYDKQLDRITSKELNELLNEKIDLSFTHTHDEVKHITAEERNRWNTILSGLKPATEAVAGLMSAEDKFKLNKIENFATNYRHPNSGVTPGSYLKVTVNEQGHIIYGENPARLNVTVDNAEKLGGYLSSQYAKLDSPTFTGIVKVPDVTIAGNPNSPATIKLLEDYVSNQILNKVYPIGSIYITLVNTNPSEIIGGEWRRVAEGRCLVGVSAERNITLRKTGGTTSVILSENNIPAHDHTINITGTTDNNGNHTHIAHDVTSFKTEKEVSVEDRNAYEKYARTYSSERYNSKVKRYVNETLETPTSEAGGHTHTFTVSGKTNKIGGSIIPNAVNIENPYLGVYMWERIS